jgi:hypothetical protein
LKGFSQTDNEEGRILLRSKERSDVVLGKCLQVVEMTFSTAIKKAAANAAAKVRRWIKELQINVSEHRGDKPNLRFI